MERKKERKKVYIQKEKTKKHRNKKKDCYISGMKRKKRKKGYIFRKNKRGKLEYTENKERNKI